VAVSPDGQFLFVANQTSSNVSVLSINQATGALGETLNSLVPLAPAAGPTAIAVHPSGNLLFVTNNNNNPNTQGTLSVFIIQSTGSLTNVVGSPFPLVLNPQALALNATGTVVYVANKGANSISALSIDQNTGVLSLFDTELLPNGTAPSSVAVGPGGQFLYVANSGAGAIDWLTIDPVTGELSAGGTAATVANPQFIRIDPAGRLLYSTNSTLDLVSIFSIDPVAGPLTATGTRAMRDGPAAVAFVSGTAAVAPIPTFAYAANAVGSTVSAFAITPATGLLTELVGVGSPFSVAPGAGPVALSADPLSRFVFVGNSGTNDVSAFTINGTTGSLTGIAGSPFPLAPSTNPQSVASEPLGRYVYVVNQGSDNVSAFSIASGTGILTAVTGSPFSTGVGTGPRAVTVEPSGRFAYVVYAATNQVSLFPINQTNGALMGTGVLLPLAVTAAPQAIVVDSTGRFLYVANNGTDTVSAYLIDAATGLLTELVSVGSPFSVAPGAGPVALSADPLGRFLYVANGTSNNVSAFAIDQATGDLAAPSIVSVASPQSIAVDLSGRFAYVANASGTVTAFAINQTSGGLSATVAGSPFPAGLSPSAITTVGRF
jgi:6-phosphogluconolactonase (cycloisomerase 2 family)